MKVYMITGSVPPSMCGVGDYSMKLVLALQNEGVDAEIVTGSDWSIAGGIAKALELSKREPGIVHIQYPTNGYGHGLGPQVLSLFRNCVVTLHEFSNVHILRRAAEIPFAILAKHLVFTDAYEREKFIRFCPPVRAKTSVIPIGSNIDSATVSPSHENREILHFGAIYPHKGIEEVIAFARTMKRRNLPFTVRIAGLLKPNYMNYADELIAASKDLRVEWSLNQSDERIIDYLSSAFLAYLPYPDGASDRRGSLKAVLQGSLPCITTKGAHTMDDLGEAVLFANGPDEACDAAMELLFSSDKWCALSAKGRAYSQRYAWDRIAQMHQRLYARL